MTTINPDLKIVQAADQFPVKILAEHLIAVSQGMKKLREANLTDDAIFLLIQEAAPRLGTRRNSKQITRKEIEAVIQGMESVAERFTKKPEPTKKNKS